MLLEQLVKLYEDHAYFEPGTTHGLRRNLLFLLEQGRLVWHREEERVVGVVESWRLDFDQWGRKVCHEPVDIHTENIITGPVCYFANVIILPGHRTSGVVRILRDLFFHQNRDAEFFVGLALRKKTQPIKVFRASELSQARFGRLAEAIHDGR